MRGRTNQYVVETTQRPASEMQIDLRGVLSMPRPDPKLDRRLLRFRYLNRDRIVEPHDYGIIGGSIDLFTFQVGGSSSRTLPGD
ncbi:MAG: hypothetical protein JWO80_2103 [Bryobacterales bacterium]|nr:hypothetical protein [Bryobacterales bacterium]